MKSRIEEAIGEDDYQPLFYQNQWRTLLWDEIDNVFYGIQWGNSWLFKFDQGYAVMYAESCAVAANGDVYTVAWVEAPEEQRSWSEERRKKGVFSDVLQPYVMQLIRVQSHNIQF
jgi:hypothetical protein